MRRPNLLVAVLPCLVIACAAKTESEGFTRGASSGGAGSGSGGGSHAGTTGSGDGGYGTFGGDDGGGGTNLGNGAGGDCSTHPNDNLCSQVVDCAAQGKSPTTISGTVYTPNGTLPVYNVFVYVPNANLSPIAPGNPTCTQCQAPASGAPIVSAQTGADGTFRLTNVPSGDNIPLVMQIGKWRRLISIPHVASCQDNPQSDPMQTRLPAKATEGDMPLIAFLTGFDPGECFLRDTIGVDPSEFGPPGSTAHVQLFTGHNDTAPDKVGPTIAGGFTPDQTYSWFADAANLLKYDIVYATCEGNGPSSSMPEFARASGAYAALQSYLDGGGRFYSTHWGRDYFTNVTEWANVATWNAPSTGSGNNQGNGMGSGGSTGNFSVNQSFPKGTALAQWLVATGASSTLGTVNVTDTKGDIEKVDTATDWGDTIATAYTPSNPLYMTFNTPVTAATDQQCGRGIFSDVHIAGQLMGDYQWPAECGASGLLGAAYANNEKILAFLFFDVSTCVQDDTMPPPPPPVLQ